MGRAPCDSVDGAVASDYASRKPIPPYLRGDSELVPLVTIRQQVRALLDGLLHGSDATPTTLLVHGGEGDLECLRVVMGIARDDMLKLSPRIDEQPALQLGKLIVVDTRQLSIAVAADPLPSQTLQACCQSLGIACVRCNTKWLTSRIRHEHHAGNDALWTLKLWIALQRLLKRGDRLESRHRAALARSVAEADRAGAERRRRREEDRRRVESSRGVRGPRRSFGLSVER